MIKSLHIIVYMVPSKISVILALTRAFVISSPPYIDIYKNNPKPMFGFGYNYWLSIYVITTYIERASLFGSLAYI